MTSPGDDTIRHLKQVVDLPDLSGTKYEVVDFIARGGMGTVYRVRDIELERDAALKVISAPDADDNLQVRMIAEAKILARLEHPSIVPVHDVGTLPDGRVYYAMKFVAGCDLEAHAQENHSLPERLRVFLKICNAVAFAHSYDIIHRDLKPKNIMVGAFGEVLVLDWGVAKWLRSDIESADTVIGPAADEPHETAAATRGGTIMGTPGYMPPEQARGDSHRVDCRSDVFALGAILRFLAKTSSSERAPKRLVAIAEKAMSEAPSERYQTAELFEQDVERFIGGQRVMAYDDTPIEKLVQFAQRHRVPITLIVAYLLLRILLIIFNRT